MLKWCSIASRCLSTLLCRILFINLQYQIIDILFLYIYSYIYIIYTKIIYIIFLIIYISFCTVSQQQQDRGVPTDEILQCMMHEALQLRLSLVSQ